MTGTVVKVYKSGNGLILGDDKNNYHFLLLDVLDKRILKINDTVSFRIVDSGVFSKATLIKTI